MIVWPDAELRELAAAADKFAQDRLGDVARRHDQHADAKFPDVLKELHSMGYLDLCTNARWGGLEQKAPALAAVLEPLCAVDASAGAAIYASAAAHLALIESRLSDEQVETLKGLQGALLAWPAFHDLAEQNWPVMGSQGTLQGCAKMLLPGVYADWAVFPARSDADGKLSLVAADLRHPGVTRSEPVRTLGLSACGIADMTFSNTSAIRIAPDAVAVFATHSPQLAMAVIAMLAGVMRGSLETAAAYAIERHQGGGPIIGWGEVRRLLSLMHERLHAAQALLLTAPDQLSVQNATSYAALHVAAIACELTTDGVQLLGGNGYMKEYGQEKRMRDAHQLQCLMGGVACRRQRLMARG